MKVIAPLTDPAAHGGNPADAFHVVAPSLPGYGFSDKPARTGWGTDRIAAAWDELMVALGYERYVAQGGDWGASVTTRIGAQNRGQCAGIHVNMPVAGPGPKAQAAPSRKSGPWPNSSTTRTRTRATPSSRAPVPRPSATPWSTRPPARRRGSWRSSEPGPTTTAIPKTPSAVKSCSTT